MGGARISDRGCSLHHVRSIHSNIKFKIKRLGIIRLYNHVLILFAVFRATMEERYSFITDWYDTYAAMKRQYQLVYYPSDKTCEMVDLKQRRLFLKRSPCSVQIEEVFIGAIVNILSRQLKVVDFADEFTRSKLERKKQSSLAMIKPDCAEDQVADILDAIITEGLTIGHMRKVQLSNKEAQLFYSDQANQSCFSNLVKFIAEGPIVVLEVIGENVIERWLKLLGPADPAQARQIAPESLRGKFGTDEVRNTAHGSIDTESANREVDFFFKHHRGQTTADCSDGRCTLALIKPDAFKECLTAKIMQKITASGFVISGIGLFNVDKANAEEFYEVYKGVIHEYTDMVSLLCSGPCIALALTGQDVHQEFRQLTGPADPEIARHLRPDTLRAQYGRTKVENAVHCTDLPEDGTLEVEYFFKILDNNN